MISDPEYQKVREGSPVELAGIVVIVCVHAQGSKCACSKCACAPSKSGRELCVSFAIAGMYMLCS